ncbi:hypothetical protein JCM8097_002780 [Rhodosporidiobolus ruineniae]
MSGRIPIGSALFVTAAITTIGYGIMALTTPTEEQFYNSLSPDLKRKVDEAKRVKAAMIEQEKANGKLPFNERLEQIKAQASQDRPVFAEEPKKR